MPTISYYPFFVIKQPANANIAGITVLTSLRNKNDVKKKEIANNQTLIHFHYDIPISITSLSFRSLTTA